MELSDKAKKARNAYSREYRRKNRDKIKQYNITYWEKQAEKYSIADEAKKLSLQGLSQRQIAKELNISVGSVNKYLNKEINDE